MTVATPFHPADTPIRRADIRDMTDDELEAHVESMRERRLRVFNAYQEAQQIKADLKLERDRELIKKRCEQLQKLFDRFDRDIETCTKYIGEIRLLRITA